MCINYCFAYVCLSPNLFLSEYPDKNMNWFSRQPHYNFQGFSWFSQKTYLVCLDCTRSRSKRWKTGECTPAFHLQTGNLEAIDPHISHLTPNLASCPLLNIAVTFLMISLLGMPLEESLNSLQGHTLKIPFIPFVQHPSILSNSRNMYDITSTTPHALDTESRSDWGTPRNRELSSNPPSCVSKPRVNWMKQGT